VSAKIPTDAQIHPQPDAQPEPLPAATVTALARLLARMLVADLTQDPPVVRTRCGQSSPASNDGALRRTQP
jgi:hypothetical protein